MVVLGVAVARMAWVRCRSWETSSGRSEGGHGGGGGRGSVETEPGGGGATEMERQREGCRER